MAVPRLSWLAVLGALLLAALAGGVNIMYDQSRWTKADLGLYRLEFNFLEAFNPSDELALPSALKMALARSSHNSLDGTQPRRTVTRAPGCACLEHARPRCPRRAWRCIRDSVRKGAPPPSSTLPLRSQAVGQRQRRRGTGV